LMLHVTPSRQTDPLDVGVGSGASSMCAADAARGGAGGEWRGGGVRTTRTALALSWWATGGSEMGSSATLRCAELTEAIESRREEEAEAEE